jgi:hypothetical protein
LASAWTASGPDIEFILVGGKPRLKSDSALTAISFREKIDRVMTLSPAVLMAIGSSVESQRKRRRQDLGTRGLDPFPRFRVRKRVP